MYFTLCFVFKASVSCLFFVFYRMLKKIDCHRFQLTLPNLNSWIFMSFSKICRLLYIEKEKLFSVTWNFSNLNAPTFFVKEKIKVELQEFLHLANSWPYEVDNNLYEQKESLSLLINKIYSVLFAFQIQDFAHTP